MVTASRLSRLDPASTRSQRVCELLRYAARDCLNQMPDPSRVKVLLGLPESYGAADRLASTAMMTVETELGTRTHLVRSTRPEVLRGGRTLLLRLLEAARLALLGGSVDEVLLGIADSLVDPDTLTALSRAGKISSEQNLDGVLPGEAAAFLAVSMPNLRRNRTLGGWIAAHHECPVQLDPARPKDASMSNALTVAFRRVRAELAPGTAVDVVSSCQSGETQWDRCFTYAYLRTASLFGEPLSTRSIAESFGDVGCAGLALATALAVVPKFRDPRPGRGRKSLLHTICETGFAGALVVEADA
jgi:3-oxoacyl-[acyl-carrier-protein] synthase I